MRILPQRSRRRMPPLRLFRDFDRHRAVGLLEISHRTPGCGAVITAEAEAACRANCCTFPTTTQYCSWAAALQHPVLRGARRTCSKRKPAYLQTGVWAKKADQGGQARSARSRSLASSEDKNYHLYSERIRHPDRMLDYFHITTNNTIYGTEIHDRHRFAGITLDRRYVVPTFMSRPVDVKQVRV